MRFPVEALIIASALALAGVRAGAAAAESAANAAPGAPIASAEIQAAQARLAADPHLGHEHHIRSLRWKQSRAPSAQTQPPAWIVGLFEYLGQTGSLLLWVLGAIAAAISAIWVYRLIKARGPALAPLPPPAVTRIGELDIRPESLPEDIGAAALALAERGNTRAALSLLYRGALSRAVHRFRVQIGESHTEDEVLRAVGDALDASRVTYLSELVAVWRREVYAGKPVPGDPVQRLCRGFAAALDPGGA